MASKIQLSIPSLLSFKGRLRRLHYWVTNLCLAILKAVCTTILAAAAWRIEVKDEGFAAAVVELVFLWPTLALVVKRGHDRGRSALFSSVVLGVGIAAAMTATMVPLHMNQTVGGVCLVLAVSAFGYLFIDYGLIDGPRGPNRYGPSPKGASDRSVADPAR